jgi:hypothetical protein
MNEYLYESMKGKRMSTQERISSEIKKKADQLCYQAVALDGRSFSDFSKKGITQLFQVFNNYKPPSRQTIALHMQILYREHKEKSE